MIVHLYRHSFSFVSSIHGGRIDRITSVSISLNRVIMWSSHSFSSIFGFVADIFLEIFEFGKETTGAAFLQLDNFCHNIIADASRLIWIDRLSFVCTLFCGIEVCFPEIADVHTGCKCQLFGWPGVQVLDGVDKCSLRFSERVAFRHLGLAKSLLV